MALKDRFKELEEVVQQESEHETMEQIEAHKVVKDKIELGSVCEEISALLSKKVASIPIWFEYSESEQKKLLGEYMTKKLSDDYPTLSVSEEEKENLISIFTSSVHGFGALDYYIARDDVKAILVYADGTVLVDGGESFHKEKSAISQAEFEKIYARLSDGANKNDLNLFRIRLNKTVITLFAPPVSEKKILFEKMSAEHVTLDLLVEENSISQEEKDFLKNIISERKNLLVAAPASCGKTALLAAIIDEVSKFSRSAVLENSPVINQNKADSYLIRGLNDNELDDLLNAVSKLKYDYTINDTEYLPAILSDRLKEGYIASVEAETMTQAVIKLAGYKIYSEKFSEKQAKAFLASQFEYIVLLKKSDNSILNIEKIAKLSLNKAGSLVLS